jgi:hypothetical protein
MGERIMSAGIVIIPVGLSLLSVSILRITKLSNTQEIITTIPLGFLTVFCITHIITINMLMPGTREGIAHVNLCAVLCRAAD